MLKIRNGIAAIEFHEQLICNTKVIFKLIFNRELLRDH
jgi:hypothetical protein